MKEKRYDLHIHTKYSDGTNSVEEIIQKAKELGLSGISITDHDTMDGVEEGRTLCKKYELDFIPGIEFSCDLYGYEVHILGYFLDETLEKLEQKLKDLKRFRDDRNIKIVEKLNKLGLKISMSDIEKEATSGVVSRAHICNALLKKGYVYSKKEAFTQYLGKNKAAYVNKNGSNALEIVRLIKDCGGVSVVAHPKLISDSREKVEKVILELKENGLNGIEAEYGLFDKKDRKYYRELAKKLDLIITGGSDFHGENRLGVNLGDGYIDLAETELLSKVIFKD